MQTNRFFKTFLHAIAVLAYITFTGCDPVLKTDDLPKDAVVGTVTDIDGNVYRTIKIGNQTWMVENLKTSKYNDGTEILNVTDSAVWRKTGEGACCDYQNSGSNSSVYGKLYNGYAVDDERGIAPSGWHVASSTDWTTLRNYLMLNGYSVDATSTLKIAKSMAATSGWIENTGEGIVGNNLSKNNKSGFSALPGGARYPGGAFLYAGNFGFWWSTVNYIYENNQAESWGLSSIGSELFANGKSKSYGFSVRCVKNLATVVITAEPTQITKTSATSGGNITNDDGVPVTARGICWGAVANPTITNLKTINGAGMGTFTSSITGLSENTTYYVRAYATNSAGTVYGEELVFKTLSTNKPVLTTVEISKITNTTATSGGNITEDDGAAVTARGVCWNTSTNPTIANNKTAEGQGLGEYSSSITGLTANTTYYVRAYATNRVGTSYGNELVFKTYSSIQGTVTDVEGTVYKTITIGSQTWMAENLRTSRYRDNSVIPNVTVYNDWMGLTTGAWCNYNNDAANGTKYGKLYNRYVVTDARNIAPVGWHIPTYEEWTILTNYLGGILAAGGKLKNTGDWASPNTGATNSSGFTALPGGYREGSFVGITTYGMWWTSSPHSTDVYWRILMISFGSEASASDGYGTSGLSIRCVKDN